MSRMLVPSTAQVEKLLDYLEQNSFLATGFARTSNARERTRAAWQELASTLNSEGGGSIKTWQQWAKYWKDKKAAVKRRYSQIRLARQRTGGGAADIELTLTATEERILGLMGGEQFAVGDRSLEINPFHQSQAHLTDTDAGQGGDQMIIQDNATDSTVLSESILQGYIDIGSMAVEPGTNVENTEQQPGPSTQRVVAYGQPQPSTSTQADGVSVLSPGIYVEVPQMAQQTITGVETSTPGPRPSNTSSPRRRRMQAGAARRRAVRRSPPSQRHSQMASLTERFLAIEERRVETEHMLAQNQRELIDVLKKMSEAWSSQAETMKNLINNLPARRDPAS